jgi:hypothetical protein
MKNKLVYAVVIGVALVGAVVVWAMWRPANNPNFPQGTDWLCTNQACQNHFKLTMKELGDHHKAHYGQRPKCPKCGKDAVRAEVCAHCGKVYMQARGAQICPYCRKEQIIKPG